MPIERTITRRYGFGPSEVRMALVQYLKNQDMPYPLGSEYEVKLTGDGAVMQWTEQDEMP